jgi:chemotaxis protein CheX
MLGLNVSEAVGTTSASSSDRSARVVALVGFGGDYVGSGMITSSQDLACKMASAMLMTECAEINDDVRDALGEISNMVFGNVKTELEEELGPLSLSIPTVIAGKSFDVRSAASPSWVIVPLALAEDQFEVRVCVVRPSGTPPTLPKRA